MPVKRSRIPKSPSFRNSGGVLNGVSGEARSLDLLPKSRGVSVKQRGNSEKIFEASSSVENEQQKPRPKILTLSSPVQEAGSGGPVQIGEFFEKCSFCKKKIGKDDEVFMYSYLRAFCTSQCRENQIVMDRKLEKGSGFNTGQCNKMSNRKIKF